MGGRCVSCSYWQGWDVETLPCPCFTELLTDNTRQTIRANSHTWVTSTYIFLCIGLIYLIFSITSFPICFFNFLLLFSFLPVLLVAASRQYPKGANIPSRALTQHASRGQSNVRHYQNYLTSLSCPEAVTRQEFMKTGIRRVGQVFVVFRTHLHALFPSLLHLYCICSFLRRPVFLEGRVEAPLQLIRSFLSLASSSVCLNGSSV